MDKVLQDGVTVSDFLGYHPELKDDVVIFLSGARVVGLVREDENGATSIRAALPLRRLWRILARGMDRVELDLDDAGNVIEPGE